MFNFKIRHDATSGTLCTIKHGSAAKHAGLMVTRSEVCNPPDNTSNLKIGQNVISMGDLGAMTYMKSEYVSLAPHKPS